jgi:hypothetical protein
VKRTLAKSCLPSRALRTDDLLRIDGDRGTVERLPSP